MNHQINRRDFLRLCFVTAASLAAAGCENSLPQPDPPTPGATPARIPASPTAEQPVPSPMPVQVEISLHGEDAEIWGWNHLITGEVTSLENCQEIAVRVNGLDVDAKLEGARFTAQAPMVEGENHVAAVCKQAGEHEIVSNMLTYTVPLQQRPKATIRAALLDNGLLTLDSSDSEPAEAGFAPIVEHIWSARPGNPAVAQVQGIAGLKDRTFDGEVSGERVVLILPPEDGEYYFSLHVTDQKGRQDTSTIYVEVSGGKVRIPDYDRENPAWVESAIVYGVIPRKFGSRGFLSIAGRLDDLQDLGINALWLAPVNVSPPGDYGYAVVDYFDLSRQYGSKEDFHRMVQEAHARGIRVLMDFVPNHSSVEHPYFQDALKHGNESHYWDFYDRDSSGQPTHYFSWEHLPNLNYNNPEVERWIIEAFSYWVREFDIDGFRVDVAWGIRERNPEFWPKWRRELKRIKPDLLLLAEASARDPYYFDNGFDAAYDWTEQLGNWAWELVWDSYKHKLLTYNLQAALTNRPGGFHPDALIFRFLNNNDTGERFITRHGEGFTRVATAMLLTLPGIPCIYTGDEVGEEFRPYYDTQPLSWEEKFPGLREYHWKLIALRREMPSLRSRLWQPVEIKSIPQEVYAFVRFVEPYEQPVLVLLDFFEEPAEVELQLPEEFSSLVETGFLVDLLSEERIEVSRAGNIQIPVPGLTARILVSKT